MLRTMANKYLIQKKVKTPIQAAGSFEIHGFKIEPYIEAFQDDLLVTREIEAPNGIEALKTDADGCLQMKSRQSVARRKG